MLFVVIKEIFFRIGWLTKLIWRIANDNIKATFFAKNSRKVKLPKHIWF